MKKVGKILLILIVIALILAIAFITVNFAMSKVNKKGNPLVKIEFEGYGRNFRNSVMFLVFNKQPKQSWNINMTSEKSNHLD